MQLRDFATLHCRRLRHMRARRARWWFIVVAEISSQLGVAPERADRALPVQIAFAIMAPMAFASSQAGCTCCALWFSVEEEEFTPGPPLELAVPGTIRLLPAIIAAQTVVVLVRELLYIRLMPLIGAESGSMPGPDAPRCNRSGSFRVGRYFGQTARNGVGSPLPLWRSSMSTAVGPVAQPFLCRPLWP